MKYIQEFRDHKVARALSLRIHTAIEAASPKREYHLMEFCGGHTYALFRYSLTDLLPPNIKMVHGPGCPVCVLPIGRLDGAIELAKQAGVIFVTYGDVMRVPASNRQSLLQARAQGADIRMVYSCTDALTIAQENPDKEVVFFAIGFETTTPATAVILLEADRLGLKNFSIYCNHLVTPAAVSNILESPEVRSLGVLRLDGFIGPAHVSAIIGSQPFEYFSYEYQKPVVIAGFEPLDLLQAILMLVNQLNENRACVENQFTRVVTRKGNLIAQQNVAEVFELKRTFEWRGLGKLPYSGLKIKTKYAFFDAEIRFNLKVHEVPDPKACECGAIVRGLKKPLDCRLFAKVCTPDNPIGSCMVSSEGACGAYYRFGHIEKVGIR
ncbi:hydrogenase formation protein HypD [Bdellovibrionota bacterium FG-2]